MTSPASSMSVEGFDARMLSAMNLSSANPPTSGRGVDFTQYASCGMNEACMSFVWRIVSVSTWPQPHTAVRQAITTGRRLFLIRACMGILRVERNMRWRGIYKECVNSETWKFNGGFVFLDC